MAIIGTLPNNIQDGQLVDASPLMADFNYIVNQVNANANPVGTLTAPAGHEARLMSHATRGGLAKCGRPSGRAGSSQWL